MISQVLAAKAHPLLTAAIAGLMGDHAHTAACIPADPFVQAAQLKAASEDALVLAQAIEVLLRRSAEDD